MSLDIRLHRKMYVSYDKVNWEEEEDELFSRNITHNLNTMAKEAGIYETLWHPYRIYKSPVIAKYLIKDLESGLGKLKNNPEYYKKFNSPNGWGLYKHFVPFVDAVLQACKKYPSAFVETST